MTEPKATIACPLCGSTSVVVESYASTTERAGKAVRVTDLRRYACSNCESHFADDQLSRHNASATQQAFGDGPRHVPSPALRDWRKALGMTQREAARVFGGGLNAFSKYEIGEVVPADAMDNLLWLCMQYPGLIVKLARRRGVTLSSEVVANCGGVAQTYSDPHLLRTNDRLELSAPPDVGILARRFEQLFGEDRSEFQFVERSAPSNDQTFETQEHA